MKDDVVPIYNTKGNKLLQLNELIKLVNIELEEIDEILEEEIRQLIILTIYDHL